MQSQKPVNSSSSSCQFWLVFLSTLCLITLLWICKIYIFNEPKSIWKVQMSQVSVSKRIYNWITYNCVKKFVKRWRTYIPVYETAHICLFTVHTFYFYRKKNLHRRTVMWPKVIILCILAWKHFLPQNISHPVTLFGPKPFLSPRHFL